MARILIDGRFVGVGDSQTRYVLELTRNILKLDQENEYTLLLRPQGEKELKFFPGIEGKKNLKIKILDIPHYSLSEQTKLLAYLNQEKFDLVHFTQFNHPILYRGKHVTTIQDLTMQGHLHRQKFYRSWAFRQVMGSAARNSDKIIAITNKTEEEVIEAYCTPKSRFAMIYHGLDHERFNIGVKKDESAIDRFKKKYNIKGEYFLYTGMWKKHKNVIRMLQAFEKFKLESDSDIKMVLLGKIDKNEPEVINEINRINFKIAQLLNCSIGKDQKTNINNNNLTIEPYNNPTVITTGFVLENEIQIAYAGAKVYVMPSLNEGFGWPPLEAMGCGTPVISSNESCMPEVLGDAPIYFDPYNIDDIADKMKQIAFADQSLIDSLREKGLKQVQKYQWRETAQKTLEVYRRCLKK